MLYSFVDRQQRQKLAFLLMGITLMGVVEMAAIASIFPFLMVLSKPEIVMTHALFAPLYEALHFTDVKYFMIALGCIVFIVLVF